MELSYPPVIFSYGINTGDRPNTEILAEPQLYIFLIISPLKKCVFLNKVYGLYCINLKFPIHL